MKLRLILVVLMISPLLLHGQTTTPSSDVVFYSKGKMYVKYKTGTGVVTGENTSTALYIDGSAKFATGAAIVQKGRTDLTGDFINEKDPNAATETGSPTLFTQKDATQNLDGVIAFIGDRDVQYIRGTRPSGGLDWSNQKTKNYINFPIILVNKTLPTTLDDERMRGLVAVDTTAAILVDQLWVPNDNRFAILAGYDNTNARVLNSGHMLLKKVKDTRTAGIPATNESTYSQVNLSLYAYDSATSVDDGAFDSSHMPAATNNTLRNIKGYNYLTGFTPPFQQLGADYMFYHHLVVPTGAGYGDAQASPHFTMQAGSGYFISMDVSSYLHQHINTRWNGAVDGPILAANRARGGYVFNRKLLADNLMGGSQSGFRRFSYEQAGVKSGALLGGIDDVRLMQNEKFVTGDITVNLRPGFNFLGNPYMTPISLNPMLGIAFTSYNGATSSEATTATDGFAPDTDFIVLTGADSNPKTISSSAVNENVALRSMYWVMNNATVHFENNLYKYTTTYDYVSRDGATPVITTGKNSNIVSPADYLIAPMQLFAVQASQDATLTLKESLRTFGKTNFLKSASTTDITSDYFVVENTNAEKISDRTAVVFREGAQMDSRDGYDTKKFMYDEDTDAPKYNQDEVSLNQPAHSIVYTKSSDDAKMLGNAILPKTKELALYVSPPSTQQNMTLKFYGLENLKSVPGVWLIDRYQDNKIVKVTSDFEYDYVAGPSDSREDNRFVLRFWDSEDELLVGEEKPITCYYNTSVLYISGLNENDINSRVQIYDLQGRLLANTKIDSAPSMEYVKPLSLGTYIVKISGNRNFTTKFVNLQN